jgi:hypothetical protein
MRSPDASRLVYRQHRSVAISSTCASIGSPTRERLLLFNQGKGAFAGPVRFDGSYGFIAVADFDGDGSPDLAVASDDTMVSVLFNQGKGAFAAPVGEYPASFSRSIAAADLNGDGRPDLAIANDVYDTVSVLLDTCGP